MLTKLLGSNSLCFVTSCRVRCAFLLLVGQAACDGGGANSTSCANHAIQLKAFVLEFVEKAERFPSTSDTLEAFFEMNHEIDGPWGIEWLESGGSACPEPYRKDGSIGYVFVASSLPTKVFRKNPLVFFCPAESHQGSIQHAHAMRGETQLCVEDNGEMVNLLAIEIARGQSREIPYSAAALQLMERELRMRRSVVER